MRHLLVSVAALLLAAACREEPAPAPAAAAVDAAVASADVGGVADVGGADAAADVAETAVQPTADAAGLPGEVVPAPADGGGGCTSAAACPAPANPACQMAACQQGLCLVVAKPDGTACGSDPLCQPTVCIAGACLAQAVTVCDDGNPCTSDTCAPASGVCSHANAANGTACDDGSVCTTGDNCSAGKCAGKGNICGCSSLKDCAQFDDDNPCNGTLYCDTATGQCLVLPGSAVVCDPGADTACSHAVCDAVTAKCKQAPSADGTECEDGNPCTIASQCAAGACKAQANVCQCQSAADCASAEDGNLCNGTLYCDKSTAPYVCKVNPVSLPQCPKPASPCQSAVCEAKTGKCKLVAVADGLACDDGLPKTIGDACIAGACASGTDLSLCKSNADCAALEDGNLCNGQLFCNKASGLCELNPKTVVVCPTVDDTTCQKNQCATKTGVCQIASVANGLPCDDGDPCSVGEVCAAGQCAASASTCSCKSDADCVPQDDGDACNGTLFCDKQAGACKLNPATVVSCPTVNDTACAKNLCNPKTGKCAMTSPFEGKACDDGNSCTQGEVCSAGKCAGTYTCQCKADGDCAGKEDGDLCNGTMYCDKVTGQCKVNPATVKVCATAGDGPCAKTSCDTATGLCVKAAVWNGAQCDADGNPCTAYDYCDDGACKIGQNVCQCSKDSDCSANGDLCVLQMVCDPQLHTCKATKIVQCAATGDTACGKATCQPETGKCTVKAVQDGTPCGDSKLCTAAKVCLAGACLAGGSPNCDDALPCTQDSCDDKLGCVHAAATSGQCNDGNVCTSADACQAGNCVGTAKDCSDQTPCTADACDPKVGCVHLPAAATACNDGNACTLGDQCKDGACAGGTQLPDCDDALPCTTDSCVPSQGCVHKGISGPKCDDGNACTKGDTCAAGQCGGSAVGCDDGNPCTKDSCDLATGCTATGAVGQPCTDSNACTGPDACSAAGSCNGKPVQCDDNNPCTLDTCHIASGCQTLALYGIECNDGDACTAPDLCQAAACKGKPLSCDDSKPCTSDACQAGVCKNAPASGACSDGNPCTVGDTCAAGVCKASPLVCDDANACTTEVCLSGSCIFGITANGTPCDDGDKCTSSDCAAGSCVGKPTLWHVDVPGVAITALAPVPGGMAVGGNFDQSAWLGWVSDSGKVAGGIVDGLVNGNKVLGGVAYVDGSVVAVGTRVFGHDGWIGVAAAPGAKPKTSIALYASVGGKAYPISTLRGVAKANGGGMWVWGALRDGNKDRGVILHANLALATDATLVAAVDTVQVVTALAELADGKVVAAGQSAATPGKVRSYWLVFAANGALLQSTELAAAAQATPHALLLSGGTLYSAFGGALTGYDSKLAPMWTKAFADATGMSLVGLSGGRVLALTSLPDLHLMRPDGGNEWSVKVADATSTLFGRLSDGTLVIAESGGLSRHDGFGASICGTCLGQSAELCADGDLCTNDNCFAIGGCKYLAQNCGDGNPCTTNMCSAGKGCLEVAASVPCSDDNPCTNADQCKNKVCVGTPSVCGGSSACVLASCDMLAGCVTDPLPTGKACGTGKLCVGNADAPVCSDVCSLAVGGGISGTATSAAPITLVGPTVTKPPTAIRVEFAWSGTTALNLRLVAPSGLSLPLLQGDCGANCGYLGLDMTIDWPTTAATAPFSDGTLSSFLQAGGAGSWKLRAAPLTSAGKDAQIKSWKLTVSGPCNATP